VTIRRRPLPRATVVDRPIYTFSVDQAGIEELADGICSEALARRAYRLLQWRRDAERQAARIAAKIRTTRGRATTTGRRR
jgi:hypothetical protein